MFKSTLTVVVLSLTALGWQQRPAGPAPLLKEERMLLEYTVNTKEAVIVVEAESERSLRRIDVRGPNGKEVLRLTAPNADRMALQGFVIETRETDTATLLETYPPGVYDLSAQTIDGEVARGRALLSHELPRRPVVHFPFEGAKDIPANGLTITWNPDPDAKKYRIVVEQGENDNLTAVLPPDRTSLRVPAGILMPGTKSHVEVGTVGKNGNCTLVEVSFTTR